MPSSQRGRAILLTGTVGSGKTTIALEIGDVLDGLGEAYAIIDLDWLAWVRPGTGAELTTDEVLAENLRAVWATFRRAEVDRFVLARYLQRREQLDALRRAVDVELFVVRLVAPAGVVEERVRRRDTGRELAEHLAEAETFAIRAEAARLEDAVIDNGDRPVRDVALEILAVAGWSSRP